MECGPPGACQSRRIVVPFTHADYEEEEGHLHNHVGLTENFDQSEDEEFLVNNTS